MFPVFINTLAGSLLPICVTVVATMGITLIFKTSTTTNFAQGTLAALGCYITTYFVEKWGGNFYLGIALGIVVGILSGLFIDVVIFRKGRNVNAIGKQIITMGIVSVIAGAIPLIFGAVEAPDLRPFIDGNLVLNMNGTDIVFTYHSLVCAGITVVVIALIFLLLKFSKWGLGVRTTASNETTAELMGVNTHAVTAITWALAASLGVLAAIMYAGGTGTLSVYFMTKFQVNAFLAGILGGFSTFYGPIIGAIIIPTLISSIGFFGNFHVVFINWNEVMTYGIMLVIILFKPQGLFGKKIAKKV